MRWLKWRLNRHHYQKYDVVTELLNKQSLNEQLDKLITEQRSFSLIFLDLDDFLLINESVGHIAGDQVLREVANRLREVSPQPEILARTRGDEFVLVYEGQYEKDQIIAFAEQTLKVIRIRMKFLDSFLDKDLHTVTREAEFLITASAGISAYPDLSSSALDVIRRADEAMYFCKQSGKDCVIHYADLTQKQINQESDEL
jgi:diguanylate cyclase